MSSSDWLFLFSVKIMQKKYPLAWYVAPRGGGKDTFSRFPYRNWKFGGLPKKHPVLYVALLPLVVGKDTFKSEMSAFQSESKWTNLSEILLLMKLSFHPDPNHQFGKILFFIPIKKITTKYYTIVEQVLWTKFVAKMLSCSWARIMH